MREYLESCQYSVRLTDKLKSLDTKNVLDFGLINKAIYWAKKYHGEQKRMSGEPYYSHPLEVAYMISEYNLKTDVIVASILHDIIEDTEVTAGMILDEFGWRIAEMVDKLTRDRPDGTKLSVEEIINNAYKQKDKEVLLIKLIDRLHNIRTIKYLSIIKQREIAFKTIRKFSSISLFYNFSQIEREIEQLFYEYFAEKPTLSKLKQNYESLFSNNYQLLSLIYKNR